MIPDPEAALRGMARLVRPGRGRVLLLQSIHSHDMHDFQLLLSCALAACA